MKFGSVCSGIEAASVAWEPLGWKAAWFSEIEPFPCAVLKHHYPDVSNFGDMTTLPQRIINGEIEAPDLFCGGTPCQAFSVAGLRKSLDDARGNLSLTFCEIADAIDESRLVRRLPACIVFWENVPGVLSTSDNAFGCFLAQLCGGDEPLTAPDGWPNAGIVSGPRRTAAWRVLDAQYFGVAQRRRRVFVVASARDDFDPAAVLFEFDGVRRDTAPSREAGKESAASTGFSVTGSVTGGFGPKLGTDESCQGSVIPQPCPVAFGMDGDVMHGEILETMTTREGSITDTSHAVMQPISIQDVTPREKAQNGKGWSDDGVSYTVDVAATQGVAQPICLGGQHPNAGIGIDQTPTLTSAMGMGGGHIPAVAQPVSVVAPTITAANNPSRSPQSSEVTQQVSAVLQASMQVRRLTPVECERLQGFPDGYSAIPWRGKLADQCPDGPRYKALGNSWAVPVVRWIGKRIETEIKCKPNK